eukprot:1195317-Prorocentrum_minimum.AAC.6
MENPATSRIRASQLLMKQMTLELKLLPLDGEAHMRPVRALEMRMESEAISRTTEIEAESAFIDAEEHRVTDMLEIKRRALAEQVRIQRSRLSHENESRTSALERRKAGAEARLLRLQDDCAAQGDLLNHYRHQVDSAMRSQQAHEEEASAARHAAEKAQVKAARQLDLAELNGPGTRDAKLADAERTRQQTHNDLDAQVGAQRVNRTVHLDPLNVHLNPLKVHLKPLNVYFDPLYVHRNPLNVHFDPLNVVKDKAEVEEARAGYKLLLEAHDAEAHKHTLAEMALAEATEAAAAAAAVMQKSMLEARRKWEEETLPRMEEAIKLAKLRREEGEETRGQLHADMEQEIVSKTAVAMKAQEAATSAKLEREAEDAADRDAHGVAEAKVQEHHDARLSATRQKEVHLREQGLAELERLIAEAEDAKAAIRAGGEKRRADIHADREAAIRKQAELAQLKLDLAAEEQRIAGERERQEKRAGKLKVRGSRGGLEGVLRGSRGQNDRVGTEQSSTFGVFLRRIVTLEMSVVPARVY